MLEALLSFLLLYKYLALFAITFLASLALPLPATIILIATGAFSAQGYFNSYEILVIGFIGCVLGDLASYFIVKRWGIKFLSKIGFKKILLSNKFLALEKFFLKHSFSSIFYSRFLITNLGVPINFIAGLVRINFRKFFIPEIIGEFIYVLFYVGLGFVLGSEWRYVSDIFENAVWLIVLIVIIVLGLFFFRKSNKISY
jgi:membrane protein DedA with SNARE-associated domain